MEAKIKTDNELKEEINTLSDKMELQKRERTDLTKNINSIKKQIIVLEERLLNNTQYELYK